RPTWTTTARPRSLPTGGRCSPCSRCRGSSSVCPDAHKSRPAAQSSPSPPCRSTMRGKPLAPSSPGRTGVQNVPPIPLIKEDDVQIRNTKRMWAAGAVLGALTLAGCAGGGTGSDVPDASGEFDWKRYDGESIRVYIPDTGQVETIN